MNFMNSKQIESFDVEDSFAMVVFLYAQNFMNFFSLKLVVFSFFLQLQCCVNIVANLKKIISIDNYIVHMWTNFTTQ